MKLIRTKLTAFALVSICCMPSAYGAPITRFTVVDSSPTSWVARGFQDYTVSPALGWTLSPSRNFDNGIEFAIFGPALPGTTVGGWSLNFSAPFDAELVPGVYNSFQRWPFQDSNRPGLEFGSTGRGDNLASGFFEVWEVTYGGAGDVLSFAADFTHYGETNTDNFAIVEVRFNASAVPEPSAFSMATVGLFIFGFIGYCKIRQPKPGT